MKCDGCGEPITERRKYLCLYLEEHGFRLEVGCDHYSPHVVPDLIFGCSECFRDWLDNFEESLRVCRHHQVQ